MPLFQVIGIQKMMDCPETKRHLQNLWRWKCGMPEEEPHEVPSLDELKSMCWSHEFEQLMRNRLIMGFVRYGGPDWTGGTNDEKFDLVGAIKSKIEQYEKTGNDELLVDLSNYAMIQFRFGVHPNKHFKATDDEDHCKTKGTGN